MAVAIVVAAAADLVDYAVGNRRSPRTSNLILSIRPEAQKVPGEWQTADI